MPGNSISAQKSRPLAPFHPHGNTQGDTPWKPSRILLVRLSHLGDACHALAVYHALRQAYPQAELWWAVQPEFSDLLRNLPGIKGHLPFDRRGGFAAWPRLRKAARRIGFDLCVDAQGTWKSAWVARFSGAPVRLGLARADWREAGAHRQAINDAIHGAAEPSRENQGQQDEQFAEFFCGGHKERRIEHGIRGRVRA